MLKKIALGLGALIVVLLIIVALQPSTFVIERSATIEAPAEVVYGRIESLRAMNEWSPFAKMDPQMKTTYAGPESGVGAISSWEGPKIGKGRMTVTAVEPNQQVDIKLEFFAPMASTNRALFTLAPRDAATNVTWRMEGNHNFVGKAFSLFVDMDEMLGAEFEKGLASLKAMTESQVAQRGR